MKPLPFLFLIGCASGFARPEGARPVYALLLNGGGSPTQNFVSHVQHLTAMQATLRAAQISAEQTTVIASDGDNPGPDVAVSLPAQGKDAWLLDGTSLERAVGQPRRFASSTLPGALPATRIEVQRWFERASKELRAGDTLLIFVTDHGIAGKSSLETKIVLWAQETLSVSELAQALSTLPPSVRVVTVMAQCHSGAFAALADTRPNTCGFFSTTADRLAYGCYADAARGEGLGYADTFIASLHSFPSLTSAHERALLTDRTPDVPVRSSDLYLQRIVDSATAGSIPALKLQADTVMQVDALAKSFGLPVPKTMREMNDLRARIDAMKTQLASAATQWRLVIGDVTQDNLSGLLKGAPEWNDRLSPGGLARVTAERVPQLQEELLSALAARFAKSPVPADMMATARARLKATEEAEFRAETRLGTLARMQILLNGAVGRSLLNAEQRAHYEALLACEDVRLVQNPAAQQPLPAPFPALAYDEVLARSATPNVLASGVLQPGDVAEDGSATRLKVALGAKELRVKRGEQVTTVPVQLQREPMPRLSAGEQEALGKLVDLQGKPLASLGRGRKRVLFFWATWCKPCKEALPELRVLERANPGAVVAITSEEESTVKTFLRGRDDLFPGVIARDPLGRATQALGIEGLPSFVLFDDEMTVYKRQTGYKVGMFADNGS